MNIARHPASPYYHHLDTAHVGALGHSEGGFSTSKAASDPRISATATVSGSAINAGIHGPLFYGPNCTLCTDSRVQVMRNSS